MTESILVVVIIILILTSLYIFMSKKNIEKKNGELSELELKILNEKRRLDTTIQDVKREIESFRKEEIIKVKEELLLTKTKADEEIKSMKSEINIKEERLIKKEENIDARVNKIEEKENKLEKQKEKINNKEKELDLMIESEAKELERIANMTAEEAKDIILDRLEGELEYEKAVKIRDYESNLDLEKSKISKRVLATAINKAASEFAIDATISIVQLPSEEMKGRIIGKEGRNIKALEAATGVDLIVDDTPETVLLSSFDGVRREVARIALEKLINDGRIHPTKIEELVQKAQQEVEEVILDTAERAIMELGIPTMPKEVLKAIGKLKYRTSFGQNMLQHAIEVGHLSASIAAEIGANVENAKRAGFLHDIGKVFTHEQEGSHAILGADFLRKHSKENEIVINAVEAHHDEVEKHSIEAVIIQAADAISASRPGARRETLSNYIKRLEQLEEIANSHEGIENSYAIQAGRELRLIVNPESMNDDAALILARNIAQEIEEKMQYPGQIKVTVVRETRAIDYAK